MADVSIIIPTHNRARFLGAAIDSALDQGAGVEVIVVDDGSTDGTADLLAKFGERIRVVDQSNQGPSAARNHGAALARGEYLFFLDSDDLLEPGAIPALLAEARRLGPRHVPFGRAATIDEAGLPADGSGYGFSWVPRGQVLDLASLVSGIMPLCLTLLPARDFRSLEGLRAELRLGEDHEFALRAHASGLRYVATDVPVIRVRIHDAPRLSAVANREFGQRMHQFWSHLAKLAWIEKDFDHRARSAMARLIWIAGRDVARVRSPIEADALFALAQSLDRGVERIVPWPLGLMSKVLGPYRAERLAEVAKALLRRR
nr:glycosyltransferase [uncultured Sphingomonas sp.]